MIAYIKAQDMIKDIAGKCDAQYLDLITVNDDYYHEWLFNRQIVLCPTHDNGSTNTYVFNEVVKDNCKVKSKN